MAQFKARSAAVEVNGETVYSIVDGMGPFRPHALNVLSAHGIVEPKAGHWYKQQSWLDAFKTIAQTIGTGTLYTIGQTIPRNAKFPPDIDSLGKALPAIDVAYHMNHRGGDIGHYHFERAGERTVKMRCDNPYPCDFDRGIIAAFCARFKPKGSVSFATVKHDDSAPCRKRGADSCTYLVTW